MFIKEFIEDYKNSTITIDMLEIKESITFNQKISLLEQIKLNNTDETENEITTYDSMFSDILFDIAILKYYTNLEFSDDSLEECDSLRSCGIFEKIIESFAKDYHYLKNCYKKSITETLYNKNNTQNILNREIIKVSNKAIETLEKVSNNLDKKTLNKLMQGLSGFNITKLLDDIAKTSTSPSK